MISDATVRGGVTDNTEVVQAQDAVAIAGLDYINSVFAHNVAKLSLARAIGGAAERLGVPQSQLTIFNQEDTNGERIQ